MNGDALSVEGILAVSGKAADAVVVRTLYVCVCLSVCLSLSVSLYVFMSLYVSLSLSVSLKLLALSLPLIVPIPVGPLSLHPVFAFAGDGYSASSFCSNVSR